MKEEICNDIGCADFNCKKCNKNMKEEDFNCECQEPEPDGNVDTLGFGGRFERCKSCHKRIWH